jgi:sugar phosphate isomerase/epimerase
MPDKLPITLQMYTVRDDAARDFAATAETIAKIGYVGVELAGYGSAKTAEAAKQILDTNGLMVAGMHVGLDLLETDLPKVIQDAVMLGAEFVVCPYLVEDRRKSVDDYRRLGSILNGIGARLRDSELQLCYHNHAFEFDKFGGDVYGFDALFAEADPELVKVEMDTFWVKKAGEDPAAYLRKYPGRVPIVHLKDMTAGENPTFAEVGEGIIDYPPLFEAAQVAGTLYYVVEQDRCENHPPLESVRISFENLKKMGMA